MYDVISKMIGVIGICQLEKKFKLCNQSYVMKSLVQFTYANLKKKGKIQ